MTDITLKHLAPELNKRLQQRAIANGRTVEAEITAILKSALAPKPASNNLDLATAIGRHFADIEDFAIPEILREPIRNPPTF